MEEGRWYVDGACDKVLASLLLVDDRKTGQDEYWWMCCVDEVESMCSDKLELQKAVATTRRSVKPSSLPVFR